MTLRELLAVVDFTQQFQPYMLDHEFTLRTDHGYLSWLQSFKEPEWQLARWLEKLQEFHFRIVHQPGKSMPMPTPCLSALVISVGGSLITPWWTIHQLLWVKKALLQLAPFSQMPLLLGMQLLPKLRQLQLDDSSIKFVLEAKESDKRPTEEVVTAKGMEV